MARTTEPIRKVIVGGKVRYKVVADVGQVGGRRKQARKTFDTSKAAKDWLAKTKVAVAEGRYIGTSTLTVDQAVKDWLEVKAGEVRPNTLYSYRSTLKPLVDELGEMRVQDVRRKDIERVRDSLTKRGVKKRSTGLLLTISRQLWQWLMDNEVATANPAARVQSTGLEPGALEAFTPEALVKVRRAIEGHWLEAGFLLSLYGLRRSEVLGLKWSDLGGDWTGQEVAAATLSIARSRVTIGGSGDSIGAPKTQRGKRTLPLDQEISNVFVALRKAQASTWGLGQASSGFVIVDELCQPLRPERFSDEWRQMLTDSQIPYLDLRAARRSSVTAMRLRGVPDHLVAAWHGHDEEVMRRHYSVALDDGLKDAGASLTAVLRAVN